MLNGLAAELRTIATVTRNTDEFLRVDRQFHDAVGRASGNEALRQIIRNVYSFLTVALVRSSVESVDLEELSGLHEDIAEAIAAREPDRASVAMKRHLEWTLERVIMTQFSETASDG